MRGAKLAVRPAAAEAGALAAIDDLLARAAHRGTFSTEEADTMFRTVSGAVRDPAGGASVRSMFADAVPAGGTELIQRSRVVDALLDARLLVASLG